MMNQVIIFFVHSQRWKHQNNVTFEQISHIVLVLPLLTLNRLNAGWGMFPLLSVYVILCAMPLAQFKKRETHTQRSVSFRKVVG